MARNKYFAVSSVCVGTARGDVRPPCQLRTVGRELEGERPREPPVLCRYHGEEHRFALETETVPALHSFTSETTGGVR